MKMSGNTILITGGATDIGLSIAERLLELGNKVSSYSLYNLNVIQSFL